MIKNFSVPNPCHEKWDGMQPQENGRYCGSCQKVVIDFTKMTDQQIIDHIVANSGKKMCGTFKTSQLPTNQLSEFHPKKRTIRFLAALLLAFGTTLFSCQSIDLGDKGTNDPIPAPEVCITTGDLMIQPEITEDSTKQSVLGKIESTPVIESISTKSATTTGLIIPEPIIPEIITGDIINQDTSDINNEIIVGFISSPMPEFKGGEKALKQYLQNSIRYPETSDDTQGTVYVTFIVRKNGSIDDVKVLRGIGAAYDQEAMRLIKSMPDWNPGMTNGKPIDIQFNIPIKFKLR